MCSLVRDKPDGEDDEEDELDPRVEIELENLNKASKDINILEKELDEARAVFRQSLTDATRNLNHISKSVGNNIDKARPYFEALNQAKKAQLECQNAAVTFERASQLHKGARETISVAEEKLMMNPGMFDAAWQEMLNNANQKILEAEKEKLKHELAHQEAAMAYRELELRASQLEKQLKKSINKARPYFEQKSHYMDYLEAQKVKVEELELSYSSAKRLYSESLRKLEVISEDIHRKRNHGLAKISCSATPTTEREECIGAEAPVESRRQSIKRRKSEDRIRKVVSRQQSARSTGRYRSSLLLDLDIDFDFEDSVDFSQPHKSPSSKSVDMGCVNMKYYDDYQVLDVGPLLELERRENSETIFESEAELDSQSETTSGENQDNATKDTPRSMEHNTDPGLPSLHEAFETIPHNKSRSSTNESYEHIDHQKSCSSTMGSEFEVIMTSSSEKKKEPRHILTNRFSMIEEMEGDDVPLDALDNIELTESYDEERHTLRESNMVPSTDNIKLVANKNVDMMKNNLESDIPPSNIEYVQQCMCETVEGDNVVETNVSPSNVNVSAKIESADNIGGSEKSTTEEENINEASIRIGALHVEAGCEKENDGKREKPISSPFADIFSANILSENLDS